MDIRFLGQSCFLLSHYNTFPPIEADAQAFKSDVEGKTSAACVVLEPGETHAA
jgi:L-ascorbate metabolism protein UlaG (beta-lactamase superfamily)